MTDADTKAPALQKVKAPADGRPLLEARELTKHYAVPRGMFKEDATVRALDGVSFRLHAGRTLAVVGESGCGKSTLARQVTLIEQPTAGDFLLEGENLAGATPEKLKQARTKVQIVFQDPYGSLNPRKKVMSILEEPLVINTKMSQEQRRDRAQEMMRVVGLRPEFAARYPHMFSGGQRQRIAIARALMLNPRVVVADEPVSALDVSVQAQVLNLLMDLQEEFGVAYLFISHDLSVVQHIADDVLVMYLGNVVEHGPKEAIFAEPAHPYTRALMASTPKIRAAERAQKVALTGELPSPMNPPSGCRFHTRCPFVIDRCKSEIPKVRDVAGRGVACHRAEEVLAGTA
ncbi:Dipeptide transport ATP-binding protein DppF [Caenispirillum salinarum AK4]|uniref:Dipeptide transport ATP-binding protein DppF n=1 Tax=Caenispirillum salinarum AK4 TaxID=1238182 RepID=K9H6M5_9PROT|nr:peptide ABC transporter ATP-binding protein [Caenispirillum salinarum]EKV26263.1 Dipeptide transport ATP-binding protein DppF [Caenispirillum salinarum AK4]